MNSEGKEKGISKSQCNRHKTKVRKSKTAFSSTWAAVMRKEKKEKFSFILIKNYRTNSPPFLPHLEVRRQVLCQEWESWSL